MAELERLGNTDEWAGCLVFLLEHAGWEITMRPALGGGHLVIARRGNAVVKHQAEVLADAVYPVFQAALLTRRLRLVK